MKKQKPILPTPYEPPKDRSTIDEIMSRPIEEHFKERIENGFDIPHVQMYRGTMEVALNPGGPMTKLQEEMRTPKGNDEAINGMINQWVTQRIAFDQLYVSEIMEKSQHDSNFYDIDSLYKRKHENESTILKLLAAKKKLLTLPGISFTQVNLAQGPQQVNNGSNGNEKSGEKI